MCKCKNCSCDDNNNLVKSFKGLQKYIHDIAVDKGWWDEGVHDKNKGESIALIHAELSEALEALRSPYVSEHIPEFMAVEEELADVVIRILDLAYAFDYKLIEAIYAKTEYNKNRPYKHGGKEF
jgi:NTP pyrophosphatase (non-canonical NTP hydrolase)